MSFLFESERLRFRETTPQDAQAMFDLNSDVDVLKYTGDQPFSSVQEAQKFLANYTDFKKNGMGRWAVVRKVDHAILGWCGLKLHPEGFVDLGYRLQRKYWSLGFATEASLACLAYGFNTLRLKEIVARSVPENKASIRIMEKCGMTFSHKSFDELHNQEIVIYTITNENFSRH